jgi:RNA polymerase sigma-70 factor, ECF subfamily
LDAALDRQLAELLKRAQAGDRGSYELFLSQVTCLLREFAGRRLNGSQHVEDVVQETLLALHRARHTYDPARPVAPWLYAIAQHRLLDVARKEKRQLARELAAASQELATREAAPAGTGLWALLDGALQRLSRSQREVVQLLKLEGYSVAEVSTRTGLSEANVKVTAHRGYRALRKLLGEDAHE